ncbi:f-box domain-containing [Lecanosticta acicola]|uniref:F-box domain-containing n=1 Tax=Lecanosticta acicola TaxID=111012 RepID=A0AAI8Z3J3_9PEZI|nr:f-box domain-containing [Lecanosticta acicola]
MEATAIEGAPRGIFALPNEILLNIFALFATRDVVSFAPTCRRVNSLVIRILQQRLQVATGLDGHTLYLECGHPSERWTTSKVFCTPLGTHGLEELVSDVQSTGGIPGQIGQMGKLYTRFRPVNKEPDFRSVPRPHPAGDIPGSRTYRTPEQDAAAWKAYTQEAVSRPVNIDAHFLFTQLETFAYLGRRESTRGLLFSIQDLCEGTIRVWRDWLSKQCENKRWSDGEIIAVHHEESSNTLNDAQLRNRTDMLKNPHLDPSVLWLNTRRENVGIKFRVTEKKWRRDNNPVLFESEVEVPVSYNVELQEVIVRTTELVFKLEESKKQILNQTGKAMIFGSYIE